MPKIGGIDYSYTELQKMSGLSRSGLYLRYKLNPDITLEEMIAPSKVPEIRHTRYVIVDGEQVSVYSWARQNGASMYTVNMRWRKGVRNPYALIEGVQFSTNDYCERLFPLSEDKIAWLEETRFARIGMEDEWKIACELIGVSPLYADRLREYMEKRNDNKG